LYIDYIYTYNEHVDQAQRLFLSVSFDLLFTIKIDEQPTKERRKEKEDSNEKKKKAEKPTKIFPHFRQFSFCFNERETSRLAQ